MKSFMRFVQRAVVIAGLIALGIWLFWIGREHKIFLDNKTIEFAGESYKALGQANVSVNGGEALEMQPRDRELVKVVGPYFNIKAEFADPSVSVPVIEKRLEVGFSRDVTVSLPLLAASLDCLTPPPTAKK